MDAIVLTWSQLLYVGLGLVVFYIAQLLLFLRKVRSRPVPLELSRRQSELEEELDLLRREIEALKLRLAAQAYVEAGGDARMDDDADSEETPYAHAIRMARAGAEIEAMIRECGISRGEADLIAALYRAERQG